MKRRLTAAALATALAAPMTVFATTGYFQHGYGLKAQGMGGVGIALPQDALAPATNPAGLGFVGNRLDVGLLWFQPDRESSISGNIFPGVSGTYSGNGSKSFLIPDFGVSYAFSPSLSGGVAVYGNGGMNTTYKNSPFKGFGGTDPAGVDLTQLFIAPTLAYKPTPNHSFGVSIIYAYQVFSADGLDPFMRFSVAPGNVSNVGDDSSSGWGLKIGWTGKVSDSVTLGATYQSKINMGNLDKYRGLFAQGGGFDIPETYGAGIAFKATPALTLAGDIQRINYGGVPSVGNPVDCFFAGACALGAPNGPGFGWRDTTVYKLGVSYEWSKDLTLRAGYATLRQPIPASQTFFNILAPGVVEDHLTIGATWAVNAKNELSLGYMHAFSKTVNGSNSIPPGPPPGFGGGNANLKMHQNSLGIAWGWKY
ncbi:MAG TPA: outer membrane protein transport protein [Burkholderiales bacterium]|jgi:long-chain fatty acid transport protein|nr:outer membrane protein transport protein [Burkholderiales bacterium]